MAAETLIALHNLWLLSAAVSGTPNSILHCHLVGCFWSLISAWIPCHFHPEHCRPQALIFQNKFDFYYYAFKRALAFNFEEQPKSGRRRRKKINNKFVINKYIGNAKYKRIDCLLIDSEWPIVNCPTIRYFMIVTPTRGEPWPLIDWFLKSHDNRAAPWMGAGISVNFTRTYNLLPIKVE